MSNRGAPAWASALNLTILFWVGIGLAPLSAIIMFVSDSQGAFKFALICGLGSIVLIGSSVAFRRDADDVDAELGDEIAKLEMDTRRSLAEIRTQLRQLTLDGPPSDVGRPRPERSPDRGIDARYREEARPARPIEPRRTEHTEAHMTRRPEAEFEDTGEMPGAEPPIPPRRRRAAEPERYAGHSEDYSSRDDEQSGRYAAPRVEEEPGVYRARAASPSGLAGKLSKLRAGRESRSAGRDEADELLSGLGASADEWGDTSVPRQERSRDGDYGRGRDERRRRAHDDDYGRSPEPGAWGREPRTGESRSAGERRSRRADGWTDRREERPERARISDREAEPQTRWSEQDHPTPRANSYMDEYYGDERR